MHIFSQQTFFGMCAEIHIGISHFNKDTKQTSATCQNPGKPQCIQSIISSLNKFSTEDVLN